MLLLARLAGVAASTVVVASHAASVPWHDALKLHELADPTYQDGFHKRDPHVPDVKSQDFRTTVKCTRERDELAKELNDLLAARRRLDVQCAEDLRHHRDMRRLAEQQVERLKPVVANRTDESDLPPLYKAEYSAIMCTKLREGFLMDSKSSHEEVKQICAGNKSLTDCKLESYDKWEYDAVEVPTDDDDANAGLPTDIEDPEPDWDPDADWTGYFKQSKTQGQVFLWRRHPSQHEEPASPECFQAKAVQQQVDSTRRASKSKAQYCAKEVAKLKSELQKLRKMEDALWTEYNGHVSQKESIKRNAAKEVTTRFCAIVEANKRNASGCDDDGQEAIKAFYIANCLPRASGEFTH